MRLILCQINLVHAFWTYSYMINFNIIFPPFASIFQNVLFTSSFLSKLLYTFIISIPCATYLVHFTHLELIIIIIQSLVWRASYHFSFKCGASKVSCLSYWIGMWYSSTKIDDAPVSQMRSTQKQWKTVDVVDILDRQRWLLPRKAVVQ